MFINWPHLDKFGASSFLTLGGRELGQISSDARKNNRLKMWTCSAITFAAGREIWIASNQL